MRVLFVGGGTAGHITPAIAMAELVCDKWKGAEIAFVGRAGGSENDAITKSGYKLYTISMQGIERKLTASNIRAVYSAIRALRAANNIINDFDPDVVIGTGGYVSWPVIRAAQKRKIPTVLHESNAYPGLSTRLLAKKCDLVLLNFEWAAKHLKNKSNIRVVGNPLRKTFNDESRFSARKKLGISDSDILIVSFGGSLGSERMNNIIAEMMSRHSAVTPRIRHFHATGRIYYTKFAESYPSLARGVGGCKLLPYIDNMPLMLKAADIAITRSGAMTLSELACAGVASVLIPSPNVTANHQYENAKFIADGGGAILITEDELSQDLLISTVKRLETNAGLRDKYARGISSFSSESTNKKIIREIEALLS